MQITNPFVKFVLYMMRTVGFSCSPLSTGSQRANWDLISDITAEYQFVSDRVSPRTIRILVKSDAGMWLGVTWNGVDQ